jgi:hypothetical protein
MDEPPAMRRFLHDAPVVVFLAVLESFAGAQKHDPAWSLPLSGRACLWAESPPQALFEGDPCEIKGRSVSEGRNSKVFETSSEDRVGSLGTGNDIE